MVAFINDRHDANLAARHLRVGGIDDPRVDLAALDVIEHLANVGAENQLILHRIGHSFVLDRLPCILAGGDGFGLADRDFGEPRIGQGLD